MRANVFELGLRGGELQPIHHCFFVRVAAEFLLIGKNRIEVRKSLRKILDNDAEVALERFHGNNPVRASMPGSEGDMRTPFHFSSGDSLAGRKKSFARNVREIALLPRGKDDHSGAFFVVAGEVVEIFFLGKDVGLRNFLAAGESPKNNRRIGLCRELGATFRVDAIGFAPRGAPGRACGCKACQAHQPQESPCC